ncbi:hypothetical protein NMY22_g18671 [Coprinellus aureogranulatus]|nr:hypothetical protein NMY22_g18671 [Coprinellus aureogranulatus]
MRFTTLSSTAAVIVYLMSVTGSVSAAPISVRIPSGLILLVISIGVKLTFESPILEYAIQGDLATRDTFNAELDVLEAPSGDFKSREFNDLEHAYHARDVRIDGDIEARSPTPGENKPSGDKKGVIRDASGKPIKRPVKRTQRRRSTRRRPPRSLAMDARSLNGLEFVPRGSGSNIKQGTVTDSKGRPIKRPVKRVRSLEARAPNPGGGGGAGDKKGIITDSTGNVVKKPTKRTRSGSTRRRRW